MHADREYRTVRYLKERKQFGSRVRSHWWQMTHRRVRDADAKAGLVQRVERVRGTRVLGQNARVPTLSSWPVKSGTIR
jgi:hypothetical protein